MDLHDKIVLTFVKLKQNSTFYFLALMFEVYTAKHCARVFEEMINLLDSCLAFAIPWPSKDDISRNIPQCFEKYVNVRAVLDCTEIPIHKPSELCCKIVTYSHYKSTQTVKFLTGVTPAGDISFVSEAYGGRASDRAIFEQSQLINLLEPGDTIMVDRGFLIDEVCYLNGIKMIRPPFLKGQKQLSKSDALGTSAIAKAPVHIERSNERIKKFQILGTSMSYNLVHLATKIVRVISAVVNLSAPLFKDDKFIKT